MGREALSVRVYALLCIVLGCLVLPPGCGGKVASDTRTVSQPLSSNVPLQLEMLTNSCGANQVQDFFEVINKGTTPVKLSDITIKFWAYDKSSVNMVASLVPHVWAGGCITNVNGNPSCVHQVTGVTPTATSFLPVCGPDATHRANWEITISTTDSSTLPPGAFWSNIQTALNLATIRTSIRARRIGTAPA